MKGLRDSMLKVADIILAASGEKTSKAVRIATQSDISHAMIYVEPYSVIDSTAGGVHARNTQRLFWPDRCAVHVLRLAEQLTEEQERRIVTYVRSRVGTQYSISEAMRSVVSTRSRPSRRQFCSRLVAQAYAAAGLKIVSSPSYCTPEDLRKSERLVEISDATHAVTAQEVEEIGRDVDMTQRMRETTNKLLSGARTINPSIQDLNDIDEHLIAYPGDDAQFVQLLQASGYLTARQDEREKNAWQYDLKCLSATPNSYESKRQYCETVLGDGGRGIERYEVNFAGYENLFERFQLGYFYVLKGLYEKLLELQRQRRNVAAQWLAQYSPAPSWALADSSDELTPHSAEWFAAVEQSNPVQSAHTRKVVELAGHLEVCSICGDSPAKDYRLVGHTVSDGAVRTLRLCNDCWEIRRDMYAESFGLSRPTVES